MSASTNDILGETVSRLVIRAFLGGKRLSCPVWGAICLSLALTLKSHFAPVILKNKRLRLHDMTEGKKFLIVRLARLEVSRIFCFHLCDGLAASLTPVGRAA